ncbi:hypothetical protein ACGF5M_02540 [Gemmatimonadota bacterium]
MRSRIDAMKASASKSDWKFGSMMLSDITGAGTVISSRMAVGVSKDSVHAPIPRSNTVEAIAILRIQPFLSWCGLGKPR